MVILSKKDATSKLELQTSIKLSDLDTKFTLKFDQIFKQNGFIVEELLNLDKH